MIVFMTVYYCILIVYKVFYMCKQMYTLVMGINEGWRILKK